MVQDQETQWVGGRTEGRFATSKPSVAVLIPCYNEALTIGEVVAQFRQNLPAAVIYVYDNNSNDNTKEVALAAGAVVRRERMQGKGNVIRRMFADIQADIYVLTDGDLTYDASAAPGLIEELVKHDLDVVVGVRLGQERSFRQGHRFGNRMFNCLVKALFGEGFTDILSGYRVMSRRFAKSFPVSSSGFEIESELSIHALDLRLPVAEVPLLYAARPENSFSKLRTYRDGLRILRTILSMFRALKPYRFYGSLAFLLLLLGVLLGAPVVIAYLETGLVPRLPTAVLAATLVQLSFISLVCGILLESISALRRESKRIQYLNHVAPGQWTLKQEWNGRINRDLAEPLHYERFGRSEIL
jgi:glycosyltransferase involved in cell wall biosynthesis